MNQEKFIEQVSRYCAIFAPKYGFQVISPTIAQACLESGYGTTTKSQYHNYFGLKYRKNRVTCNNGYFEDGGSEQNLDGSYTLLPSNTAWYAFDNLEAGIEGYYQFINIPNYAKAKEAKTPKDFIVALKNAGYATDLKYVDKVMNIIKKYNLEKYDKGCGIQMNKNELNIIQKTSNNNTTNKNNRKIEFIVLHYTAGTNSKQGTAKNIADYFSKPTTKASADFIVDDVDIVQYNGDIKNRYCWAVGGAKLKSKVNSLSAKFYGICKNDNSISIEMCSRKKDTKSLKAKDDDWYLTKETISNAIKLTKFLMEKYNISINHIITHNMVTGKMCPQPWVKNEMALENWKNFLKEVAETDTSTESAKTEPKEEVKPAPAFKEYLVKVNTDALNIRENATVNSTKKGVVHRGEIYTIVGEKNSFGKLKSGAGWIKLSYTIRV
jgi:N-acetylmuramoyl-L-alanine amidase CwlA